MQTKVGQYQLIHTNNKQQYLRNNCKNVKTKILKEKENKQNNGDFSAI